MYAAEIGRLAGVRVPIVPMAHEYLVSQPFTRCARRAPPRPPADAARPRPARLLPRGGRRAGDGRLRARLRAVVARRAARRPRSRRTSTAGCSRRTGTASRRSPRTRAGACRRWTTLTVTRLINGPEAFTPDNEFCLGETEVRGLFVAAGVLRARARGRGRHRQGDGRVDPRRRAADGRLADGRPALRRRSTARRATRSRATKEVYETYYDISYPGHERQAGRPLRVSSAYDWHAQHGAAFGEKSGWERVNWYEPNAAAGDEALRPRGWAGMHWSPAIGAEHRATRERAGAVRRVVVRQARDRRGRARREFLERLCDNRVARDVGAVTYTQMLNARGGIECDFTVTRLAEERVPDRHRHGLRPARPRVDRPPRAARRERRDRRHDLALGVLRAVGAARARDILAPLTPDPLGTSRTWRCARSPSATCRSARCA